MRVIQIQQPESSKPGAISGSQNRPRAGTTRPFALMIVFLFMASGYMTARAQVKQSAVSPDQPTTGETALKDSTDDTRYRIGAGDVLAILVSKAPELSSEAVRVDQRGMIRLPMIEGEVTAACKTEGELAAQIRALYLEYKNDPSVQVFVREFQSRPVAVIGAINAPGQFRLQRRVRLLELLSFASGPSERAGRSVEVIHGSGPDICEAKGSDSKSVSSLGGMSLYTLNDTLKGVESANPFVQPGDVVHIPEADVVFVYGHVIQPRAISLKDKPVTVSWAIAMAGGPQRDAQTDRIRIIRQASDGGKQEIPINLKAIEMQKAPDIVLLPNDIVAVGTSATKTILGILQGAIAPAISQGAIRVIP